MILKLKIYISLVLIVLLVSCLLILKKFNEKKRIEKIITTIPEFAYITLNNNSFNDNNILSKKSRIIINHFSPNCEHCQYMAGEFIKD